MSGMTILIVKIRHHWPRLGTALKVWGIFILVLVYAFMFTQFFPLSGTLDGLYVAIATCIIPALAVRIHNTNKQIEPTIQKPGNEISPKVWIIILPVVFLVFCAQFEFMVLPDYIDFGDVLVFWCMVGLASLIILLAMNLGGKESADLSPQKALQRVQMQR